MRLNNTFTPKNKPAFQAKFLNSESLKMVADYAVERGKFEKLNQARKNISTAYLQKRIRMDIGEDNGKPFVSFTRYRLKDGLIEPKQTGDLIQEKVTILKSEKACNPLKFAFEKIIKMGNGVPQNKMFQNVVIKKN